VVEVPEIEGLYTQARRLDQVTEMVLDGASLLTDRPESDFEVEVVPILDDADAADVAQVRVGRARLKEVAPNGFEPPPAADHTGRCFGCG
jgi:hypothetical protein